MRLALGGDTLTPACWLHDWGHPRGSLGAAGRGDLVSAPGAGKCGSKCCGEERGDEVRKGGVTEGQRF